MRSVSRSANGRRGVGSPVRCEKLPGIDEGLFSVEVDGAPSGGATVILRFVGEGDGVSGRISGYEIGRRFRGALNRLAS